MSIWRWACMLDAPPSESRITLGEGSTPLIVSRQIGPALGFKHLYLKLESGNPTGSYKDRFAAAAISQMRVANKQLCVATSSGNTGSALAAYCAAAGIRCKIAIVESAPSGKLLQMRAYGADLFRVKGFGLDPDITRQTFETLENLGRQPDAALQISAYRFSPVGMAGVQTISYELVEELPNVDHVFVPAGGGGLTLAIARGFRDLVQSGRLAKSPRVHCVQPAGNDTIAGPIRRGNDTAESVVCTTRISGLQVPSVVDGDEVIAACRESGGTGHTVEDGEVFQTQRRLAREEGVYCEPAAAVALTGALQAVRNGEIGLDDVVVCLVTGSGFKDLASIESMVGDAICPMISVSQLEHAIQAAVDISTGI